MLPPYETDIFIPWRGFYVFAKKGKGTYMYAIFTKGKLLFRGHLGVISL